MLRVALDELTALSTPSPTKMLYGADIDGAAADWAAHLVSQGVPAANLLSSDFLSLSPGQELPLVAAVVGNPPYVRHHRMSDLTKRRAAAVTATVGAPLTGRASLWAYFVIHSCRFIKPGGRLALLLPGAVLQADYASAVLRYVGRCFTDVLLVRVAERIFDDAAEETVVLLASNARAAPLVATDCPSSFDLAEVTDLVGLEQLLARRSVSKTIGKITEPTIPGVASWKAAALPKEGWELLVKVFQHAQVTQLSEVARITLGTVTGANDFFLLSEATAQRLDVFNKTVPVVSRSSWLTGPQLSSTGLASVSSGSRGRLLLLPRDHIASPKVRCYIEDGEIKGYQNRRKCQRDPWWSLVRAPIPDAFLPYTVGYPRGVALNAAAAASTNTVHQITWRGQVDSELARSWALSTWSAVGRLCSELFGRHYGGGVLKLELAEAQRIRVVQGLRISTEDFDSCGKSEELARAMGDSALLSAGLGIAREDLSLLQACANILAQKRNAPITASAYDMKERQAAAGHR